MKNFDKSELWSVLHDPEATASIALADATLDKFTDELHNYCREEEDLAERHRTLTFARGFLSSPHDGAQDGKFSSYLSDVAVRFIDGELELLKLELEYPARFVKKSPPPLAIWNGTIADLLELLTPVQLAGKLLKPSHEPMAYADIIRFIGDVFGIRVAQPYKRKTDLLNRVKGGAPFLEKLIAIYLGKVENVYK